MGDDAVLFIGVAKVSAGLLVASYTHTDTPGFDVHAFVKKFVRGKKVKKLTPPADLYIPLNKGGGLTLNAHVDGDDYCYVAITPQSYPRRHVFAAEGPCLMNDMRDQFVGQCGGAFASCTQEDGLTKASLRVLKTVATKYSDLKSIDKIRNLQVAVDGVKVTMTNTLSKAIDRGERIDVIDGKTEELQLSSELFAKRADRVKRIMRYRYYKLVCVLVTLVLVVLLYICLPLITSAGSDDD